MNVFALILIAIAAFIELGQAALFPFITRNYARLHPLALGLFFTGFILQLMFAFWVLSPITGN